mmetsp:Transcript_19960/g.60448  ORF Transcript_19960/g.60448 Transcript_19960/m.60448 type:complete len:326 (-) Transcript_19960:845-1822(-)
MAWVKRNSAPEPAEATEPAPAPVPEEWSPAPGSKEVSLDGLALLKIAKHCSEALPAYVSGQLLGLDDPETGLLEVTNAFGIPQSGGDGYGDDENMSERKTKEYEENMLRNLREVNVDNNNVGWYQAVNLNTFNYASFLQIQYKFQTAFPESVCIVFDPVQTLRGNLVVKALRLSDRFMELMHFNGGGKPFPFMAPGDVYEDLPLRIRNSGLGQAYLLGLGETGIADTSFDLLDLSTQPYLEKHLETLSSWIDDLCEQQVTFHRYVHAKSHARRARRGRGFVTSSLGWAGSFYPCFVSFLAARQILQTRSRRGRRRGDRGTPPLAR